MWHSERKVLCRQVPQDWGGLTEMEEQYESGGGRQGEGMWKTGVNQLEEREVGPALNSLLVHRTSQGFMLFIKAFERVYTNSCPL